MDGISSSITDEEYRDKVLILREKKAPSKALVFARINTFDSVNRESHYTQEYDSDFTVLRRGERFQIELAFDRSVDVKHDKITLQFTFGPRPKESKGTVIRIPLDLEKKTEITDGYSKSWKATSEITEFPTTVRCFITSPPNAHIGYCNVYVDTKLDNEEEGSRFNTNQKFAMIFNPWCRDDTVYIENNNWRKEYVLNDVGSIWLGYHSSQSWNFGQFEKGILEAAFYLLDVSELGPEARRSPILICRTLSSFINSPPHGGISGVLTGRWDFTDVDFDNDLPYVLPWEWTGSVEIIKDYMKTKRPVEYGQCWVFSAVSTTLCRAIGIPTRSVTNYSSAHDTDCSMTIDFHFDTEGNPVPVFDDSVWNFHVWNESWFRRPDLPDGYDGWQVHDATPQERSEGVYRCGPASVKAIKEGVTFLLYDTPFVFAEVNGDKIKWEIQHDGTLQVLDIDTSAIGKPIVTKAVGSDEKDIITEHYKYPEFSDKEREVVARVNKFSSVAYRKYLHEPNLKPEVDIIIRPRETAFGDDLFTDIDFNNTTSGKKCLMVVVNVYTSLYTNKLRKHVKKMTFEQDIDPQEGTTLTVPVLFEEYRQVVRPDCAFKMFVWIKDLNTGVRGEKTEESIILGVPSVEIKAPDKFVFGEETKATISFTNETPSELKTCSLTVTCLGALEGAKKFKKETLKKGELWRETVILKLKKSYDTDKSERVIIAKFLCNQLLSESEKKIKLSKTDQ